MVGTACEGGAAHSSHTDQHFKDMYMDGDTWFLVSTLMTAQERNHALYCLPDLMPCFYTAIIIYAMDHDHHVTFFVCQL